MTQPAVGIVLDAQGERRLCAPLLATLTAGGVRVVDVPLSAVSHATQLHPALVNDSLTHLLWLATAAIPTSLDQPDAPPVLRVALGSEQLTEQFALHWPALTRDTYTIDVRVERFTQAGARTLQQGRIGLIPWSIESSLQAALVTAADLLAKALSGSDTDKLRELPPTAASVGRRPRRSLQPIPVLLQRVWYAAFIKQGWTLGIAPGDASPEAGWIKAGKLLRSLGGGDFLADPFVVPGMNGRVLLCEWMQAKRGRGVIARVELDGQGAIADIQLLIDWPPYHLSYPHVVRIDGKLYCSPESCHSRSVKAFELSADARSVVSERTIFDGFPAVDPTLVQIDGRWWLFCTSAFDGRSNSHLYAFHAAQPQGPWTPHRANPIVVDVASARPAGRIFKYGNAWYRPAQDCSERYGGALRLSRIERLTPEDYDESPCWSVLPPVGRGGRHGVHTINCGDSVTVYDAYTEQFSPIAWLYRLREWVR